MAKQRRMPRYAPLRAALRCRPLRLVAPFCGLGRRMASRNAHGMAPGSLRYALVALAAIRSVVTMLVSVSRIWCPAGTRYGWRIGFRAPARDIEKAALMDGSALGALPQISLDTTYQVFMCLCVPSFMLRRLGSRSCAIPRA